MKEIARVILEEATARKQNLSLTTSTSFKIGTQTFYRINDPQKNLISAALKAISDGATAAVFTKESLQPDAIFFDMDGTIIEEESLVAIAKVVNKEQDVEHLTTLAMRGDMDFKTSLKERLRLLKGLTRSEILSIKPTICSGVPELFRWCKDNNIKLFLISGGFFELAEPLAKKLGCSNFLANRFAWQGDIMRGDVEGEIIDAEGKKEAVLNWIKENDISSERCLVVGDGANDLLMMKTCGLAVGFRPKPILWPHLNVANHTGDHRFLLESIK